MDARMKKLFLKIGILILLQCSICFAQVYESPYIAPDWLLEFNKEKIFTVSNMQDANVKKPTYFYDGYKWQDLNFDTLPTFHPYDSKAVISEYSNSLYMTGHYHLWEYDGKVWHKHAINDSLYHKRRFEQMIELQDSSLLITAKTFFVTLSSGNIVIFNAIRHELLKFKNGIFSTISTYQTSDEHDPNLFQMYGLLKKQKRGRYSYITNEFSENKQIKEFVLFEKDGSVVNKFRVPKFDDIDSPKLDIKYKNAKIKYNDYLFDNKGSIWFLTQSDSEVWSDSNGVSKDTINFAGLIEVNTTGEVKYYNHNMGIQPSFYNSTSFDIDENDNIWFMYNYRKKKVFDGTIFPSLYMLNENRSSVKEYLFEELLANSRIYTGGISNDVYMQFIEHKNLKCNSFRGSVFITSSLPMIEFFPFGIPPTSVKDLTVESTKVFPNPVPIGKDVQLENSKLIGNSNQVKVTIRDVRGAIIKEFPYTLGSEKVILSLSTDGLTTGTYFVSVMQNNNQILQTSFIKE